jgi:hypothetical protein
MLYLKRNRSIMKYIKSYLLQTLLAIVATLSWLESSLIGNKRASVVEDGVAIRQIDELQQITGGAAVDISTGFNGGALSMGLICSVCIVMIVWIEISKAQR